MSIQPIIEAGLKFFQFIKRNRRVNEDEQQERISQVFTERHSSINSMGDSRTNPGLKHLVLRRVEDLTMLDQNKNILESFSVENSSERYSSTNLENLASLISQCSRLRKIHLQLFPLNELPLEFLHALNLEEFSVSLDFNEFYDLNLLEKFGGVENLKKFTLCKKPIMQYGGGVLSPISLQDYYQQFFNLANDIINRFPNIQKIILDCSFKDTYPDDTQNLASALDILKNTLSSQETFPTITLDDQLEGKFVKIKITCQNGKEISLKFPIAHYLRDYSCD